MPQSTRPTLVLVHGLDSTRHTWAPFIADSQGKWNVLAVDQRGHGDSPLGDEREYSVATVVADIHAVLEAQEKGRKVVMLGHSMGGKIAMAYAAAHPDRLAALVIEDMDLRNAKCRDMSAAVLACPEEVERRRQFSRGFPTRDATKKALATFTDGQGKASYDGDRIEGWFEDGRVYQRGDGSWWSGINPLAQLLALRHVLGQVGTREWSHVGEASYPTSLFVAGVGSACDFSSIARMQRVVPRAALVRFPTAHHSIHNSDRVGFIDAVQAVYAKVEAEP